MSPTRRICAVLLLSLLWTARAGAHELPTRIETRVAGGYRLEIALIGAPSVERSMRLSVKVLAPPRELDGLHLTAVGLPGVDTFAVRTEVITLRRTSTDPQAFTGEISFPVQGKWRLQLHLQSRSAQGTARLPLTIAAPYAIPVWVGWVIGLSPMLGVFWFAWWQRTRYRPPPDDSPWLVDG